MEKELEKKLNEILIEVKRLNYPWWKYLRNGFLTSFGTVIGVVVAVAILGYIATLLNLPNKLSTVLNDWLDTKIQSVNNNINPIQKYIK